MAGRLAGRVALITGGGQGIGLGIARAFAQEGASLVITGRTESKLVSAAAELADLGARAEICVADIAVVEDADRVIKHAMDAFGALHVLVNNAAATDAGVKKLEDTDEATLQLAIQSSLCGTFRHMVAAYPHLKAAGGGSIINFGSRTGVHGLTGFGAYAAAKEGIRGLSRVAAREWGPHNIRVNVICPAAMSPVAKTFFAEHPAEAKAITADIALGRMGDPEADIAPVAVFLASDESRYVTGQTINVDGGQVML